MIGCLPQDGAVVECTPPNWFKYSQVLCDTTDTTSYAPVELSVVQSTAVLCFMCVFRSAWNPPSRPVGFVFAHSPVCHPLVLNFKMKRVLRLSEVVRLTNELNSAPYADLNKRSEYEKIEDELQLLSGTYLFDVVVRKTDFIGRFTAQVTSIVHSELISQQQVGSHLRQKRVWYSQIDLSYCTPVSFCTIHVLFLELFFIRFDLFDYLFIYIFCCSL